MNYCSGLMSSLLDHCIWFYTQTYSNFTAATAVICFLHGIWTHVRLRILRETGSKVTSSEYLAYSLEVPASHHFRQLAMRKKLWSGAPLRSPQCLVVSMWWGFQSCIMGWRKVSLAVKKDPRPCRRSSTTTGRLCRRWLLKVTQDPTIEVQDIFGGMPLPCSADLSRGGFFACDHTWNGWWWWTLGRKRSSSWWRSWSSLRCPRWRS